MIGPYKLRERRSMMLNFDDFEVLTFDCYGTLIDWETGIWNALQPILANHHITASAEQAFELYGQLEAEAERGTYQEYKMILQTVLQGLGAKLGFTPTALELQNFSLSVKDWQPFPDTTRSLQALKKKYKLVIL